ncbi:ABC transporter substrate-binding protein [Paenibacillus sp. 598K]|uniref:extracellular solute-binding protein n=1 Tax=Paenibacillus sp. 598K TaxID=1117987 RepID=UPI000FF9C0A7|nr:extracellular solute-binding protein [Paenibacillus sp. 598K]GBF75657.1 ABC transporter substrate-binding protein [Paenibacillus sp. 598K]
MVHIAHRQGEPATSRCPRLAAVLTAVLLVALSLPGCLTGDGHSGSGDAAGAGEGDGVARGSASDEITIFSFDRRNYEQSDRVLQEIERQTDTKLNLLTGVWDDTQLDIMVATGEYPDVITIVDSEKSGRFNKWAKEGTIIPFSAELIAEFPHLQALFAEPQYQKLKLNGQFYGLPLKDEFPVGSAGQHVLVMRQDWLDALRLPAPQTLEELRDTLRAFKHGDPDGNGLDDTYGLIDAGLPTLVKNLMGAWGIPVDVRSSGFLQVGSGYEYWAIQPEVKEALAYVKSLYEEKLIVPDTLSMNSNIQVRSKFVEGRTGALFDNMNIEELIKKEEQLRRHIPAAELVELSALQGPRGERGYSVGSGYWGYTVITDKARNPRAVARLFDFLLSEEGRRLTLFGVPGLHYSEAGGEQEAGGQEVGGLPKKTTSQADAGDPSGRRYQLHQEERAKEIGFDPNNPGGFHELSWGLVSWTQMDSPTYLEFRTLTYPGFPDKYKTNMERVNRYLIEPAAYGLATPKWVSFKANSDELYTEYFNQIIMGRLDLEEGFATFVEKWLWSGGAEAMQEMSAAIAREEHRP